VVYLMVAALGLGGLLARPARAADLTVQPAANQFGAGRPGFTYTVNPGGEVQDGLVVVNSGSSPRDVPLRLSGKGLSEWVRPELDAVTIGAGESVEVPFTLTLPKDAAPGDYAGRIAGLPVRLRVSGPLKPSLSVEHVQVHYAETANPIGKGDAKVTYTIHNTGNAILSARQKVSVSGPFGRWEVAGDQVADSPPLLPGESRTVSVPVRGVTPVLRLTATVELIPLMTDAAGSTAPLAAVKATGHHLIVPWALLAVIVVLGGLALALTRVRRRSAVAREPGV
jgi:hypothetical protein